jgi:hypothetical protein
LIIRQIKPTEEPQVTQEMTKVGTHAKAKPPKRVSIASKRRINKQITKRWAKIGTSEGNRPDTWSEGRK